MGLDRLKASATLLAVLAVAGCGDTGPPRRLLHGERAVRFMRVENAVVTQARLLTAEDLGRRLRGCRAPTSPSSIVVERVGVFAESLAVLNGDVIDACDGGIDPVGERSPPWCGVSVGRLVAGRLLDPRLDILCEDGDHEHLAYAFVTPVAGAYWIGIDQGSYTELYEVLGGLPVRVATTRGIDIGRSSATFEVTQYDAGGRELTKGELEATVAG